MDASGTGWQGCGRPCATGYLACNRIRSAGYSASDSGLRGGRLYEMERPSAHQQCSPVGSAAHGGNPDRRYTERRRSAPPTSGRTSRPRRHPSHCAAGSDDGWGRRACRQGGRGSAAPRSPPLRTSSRVGGASRRRPGASEADERGVPPRRACGGAPSAGPRRYRRKRFCTGRSCSHWSEDCGGPEVAAERPVVLRRRSAFLRLDF